MDSYTLLSWTFQPCGIHAVYHSSFFISFATMSNRILDGRKNYTDECKVSLGLGLQVQLHFLISPISRWTNRAEPPLSTEGGPMATRVISWELADHCTSFFIKNVSIPFIVNSTSIRWAPAMCKSLCSECCSDNNHSHVAHTKGRSHKTRTHITRSRA